MLLRLVPFVEANDNLIELGPRETGKTYTYRNTSSRSFVISGGKATPATLFYNVAIRKTTAGLLKLIYPHRTAETLADDELASCLALAFECRQRVVEQLAIQAPGEFQVLEADVLR